MIMGYDNYRNLTNTTKKQMKQKQVTSFQSSLVDPGPDLVSLDRFSTVEQGCQMFFFKPKIQIWVYIGGPSECKMLFYFMTIWYNLWSFCIFFSFGKFGPRKI
jgi:hypothetical protein